MFLGKTLYSPSASLHPGDQVFKWVPANLHVQGGIEILLAASFYGNQDKLRPDWTLGSYADLNLPYLVVIGLIYLKVALDPYYNYVCIYFKSMHELRRLKPTKIEIFMRIYFLKFFV